MKTSRQAFLTLLMAAFLAPPFAAQATPESDFIADAQADYQTLDSYINGCFAGSMGFFTSLGWNTPAQVFDLVSGPRVEIGVGAGADLINLTNLNSISLKAVQTSSNLSLPTLVPAPFPVVTGKVGLLNGLDLGLKFNYLPQISLPTLGFATDFFGWGLDLRYKLVEGATSPTVTVGVSFDDMAGNLSISTNINQSGTYNDNGTPYSATLSGTSTYALHWETKSFGAQIQVGKDLGILYPFGAIGFQRNSGSITSTMTGNGTIVVNGGSPTAINIAAVDSQSPVLFEPRYVLGLDFGMGLHWALVGESNGTDISGSTSFRVQF